MIVDAATADACRVPVLVATHPYATYARVAAILHPPATGTPGVHASASVADSARIHPTASIGPHVAIGEQVEVNSGASIGPGCVVMDGAKIGAHTRLVARVTVMERAVIGERCILHPGVVIGADGFGFAPESGGWVKVPQVGAVRIGNDVEIGANTTIDRGAIEDTVIEDGVKLDNQIQIGHNVRVGAHTAMASGVGVAGSTTIGKRCLIAGKVGITGQIEICDNVVINGHTTVSGSILKPGQYSGAIGMDESRAFRRNAARFRQLDEMAKQLREARKRLGLVDNESAAEEDKE